MNWHDVALILDAFCDERLLPVEVAHLVAALSRTQSGGEHEHVVLALEASFHHGGEGPALRSGLVDGYAEGRQARKIHQDVVDQIAETAVIVPADDAAKRNTVDAAERMVRHKGVEPAVVGVGQVLTALHVEVHLQVLDASLQPRCTLQVATVPQEFVHLILMDDALQPRHQRFGHPLGLAAHLRPQNILYVDCFLSNCLHVFWKQYAKIHIFFETHYTFSENYSFCIVYCHLYKSFIHFWSTRWRYLKHKNGHSSSKVACRRFAKGQQQKCFRTEETSQEHVGKRYVFAENQKK